VGFSCMGLATPLWFFFDICCIYCNVLVG
jgi:hypothetical protein